MKASLLTHSKNGDVRVFKMLFGKSNEFLSSETERDTHTCMHRKTMLNLLPDENFPISLDFQHLEECEGVERREIVRKKRVYFNASICVCV